MSRNCTIPALKKLLKERNLQTSGSKAELIGRLEEFDKNIWQVVAEQESRDDQQDLVDEDEQEIGNDVGLTMNSELMHRELELLRRERDLMQRELTMLRREQSGPYDAVGSVRPENAVSSQNFSSANLSIRAISDLLYDFDGKESTFWKWEKQVAILRENYQLDDNATRVLISSKLKGRAANWFYSKSQYLTLSIEDLLKEMKMMFDHRPSRLLLRKEFENRVWKTDENFADYYHEKVILGNRVPIDEDELIDYIIDGITDSRLRDQARIMCFDKTTQLLKAFEKISVDSRKNNCDRGKQNKKSYGIISKENIMAEQQKVIRKCFNCQETGHISRMCTKPKREQGACFECGSTSHQLNGCPRRMSNLRKGDNAVNQPIKPTSSNMVHSADSSVPYMVSLIFNLSDKNGINCKYTTNAMIDSGSPISLIKRSLIPTDVLTPLSDNEQKYFGINASPLRILGTFQHIVEIENIPIELKFYIVPDDTMVFMVILGRNFIKHNSIKVTFGQSQVFLKKNKESSVDELNKAINQIMNIDYIDKAEETCEKLQINPNIGADIVSKIKNLYESVYINMKKSSTLETDVEMKIILKHDKPISFKPRRLSFADKQKLQEILDNLLSRKIIRPSESQYASPIVMAKKKNGETRLCVDFRELNKITVKDNFPSQLIDDNIDQLKNKRYFTTLDLKDGYFNLKMAPDSVKYTSFVTPLGQFEYLRCPFGLTNAPKVFHRFVQKVFAKLIRENKILIFFDDFLIATETLEEHFEILQEVFRLSGQYNLTFRLDKCFFAYNEVDYLGYHVNVHGIRPSDNNISSIVNYPVPRSAKEVLRFVSLASYFRRFIPRFSLIAKPLYNLVKKDSKFQFKEKENEAFETLKNHLSNKPILAIYSPKAETELHCDASVSGFGAILLQKQENKLFKPISYFSQRTSTAESKYHSFELECLAVVYAIKRFHIYLSGIPFKVITDCDSFRLTLSKKSINPRISRWVLFLQSYNYTIEHRPGKKMSHVDALSRCHGILVLESNSFDRVLSIKQDKDEEISKIRDRLEKEEDKYFELRDGLVYRKAEDQKLLFYVPKSLENNVIRIHHDDIGHVGVDKVVDNIKRVYWFPKLREKVKTYIMNCLKCIEFSPVSGKHEGFLHSLSKGNVPFETIHIDHYGPLEKTSRGFKYIFLIVDGFTKFIRLYPCKSTSIGEVIKHLTDYFRSYSKPKRIISDRGTCFTSNTFTSFITEWSIKHVLIAVSTPRANGQVERFNRTAAPMLAKLSESVNKWDNVLHSVEYALNNTYSRSTKVIPSKLLFGVRQLTKSNDLLFETLESLQSNERNLQAIRNNATKIIEKVQKENEYNYNKRRKPVTAYKKGDYVVIKNHDTTPRVNKKLIPKYKGPYVIKEVLDFDRYVVSDIDGFQVTQIPYKGTVSADQMKMWDPN